MTKVLHCRELGFDCDGVVRAETEEEVLQQVAEHAREVHKIDKVPPGLVEQARDLIKEE
jgi:predicted small metal-binding protein